MGCEIVDDLFEFGDFLLVVMVGVLQIGYSFILIGENRLKFEVGLHLFVVKFPYIVNTLSKILIFLL